MFCRKRILAFGVDYLLLLVVYVFMSFIPFYREFIVGDNIVDKSFDVVFDVCWLVIMLIFVGKDVINGQSVGKRLVGIKVVAAKGDEPRIWQLFIRNITIFIWPIEAILLLLNKKRIGDMLAQTDIAEK